MLGITNANAKTGVTLEELEAALEAALENQTTQLYIIIKGELPLTSVANLYKNNTAAGVYPDNTFEYVYTSEVTNFSSMFEGCTGLTEVSNLDTHNGSVFYKMFYGCTSLTGMPDIDTKRGANFSGMFQNTDIREVRYINTSNGTDFSSMFEGCAALESYNTGLNTSRGTNFSRMFYGCTSLDFVPEMDTSKGTNFSQIFYGCTYLTDIPDLCFDSYSSTNTIDFSGCTSLININDNEYALEGHRWNLEQGILNFGSCPLTKASILKVFNGVLPAIGTSHTITISSTTNGYLSAEDKAIAENKGWTVTVAA